LAEPKLKSTISAPAAKALGAVLVNPKATAKAESNEISDNFFSIERRGKARSAALADITPNLCYRSMLSSGKAFLSEKVYQTGVSAMQFSSCYRSS
jgi:hypothetical protein